MYRLYVFNNINKTVPKGCNISPYMYNGVMSVYLLQLQQLLHKSGVSIFVLVHVLGAEKWK